MIIGSLFAQKGVKLDHDKLVEGVVDGGDVGGKYPDCILRRGPL